MEEQVQLANELHKPARKNYPRRQTLTFGIDDLWQADLVEMHELASKNKKYNYMLTVIDTFSKQAFAIPIKNKTAQAVSQAFEGILKHRKPNNLQTDQGKEFFNKAFQDLMKQHKINHYHTFSNKKAAIVERFNRTLKGRMWKKFTELNSHNWLDILDDLIEEYNAGYHRTIKRAPVEVNKSNEGEVRELLQQKPQKVESNKTTKITKFKKGDIVRISRAKGIFDKGYKFNWSEELFKIRKVLETTPITYHIEDMSGEAVEGCFYNEELLKTKLPNYARIEKVLRKKIVDGKVYLRVKWKDYDNKFNSWILQEESIKL